LTERAIVLDKGKIIMEGPSSHGSSITTFPLVFQAKVKRIWKPEEIPTNSSPFIPIALRLVNQSGTTTSIIRSAEKNTIEI